ncbi:hypothetical protein IRJ41_016560, partial [Triplophysa rosa]
STIHIPSADVLNLFYSVHPLPNTTRYSSCCLYFIIIHLKYLQVLLQWIPPPVLFAAWQNISSTHGITFRFKLCLAADSVYLGAEACTLC